MNKTSQIYLQALELEVFLGWPEEERNKRQKISVDMQIQFSSPPTACLTDDLNDTICYDTLVKKIKNHVADRHFRLLEKLSHDIYHIIKETSSDIFASVRITKKPDIENLSGGVSFIFGDETCAW